jgi:hypothetical protein
MNWLLPGYLGFIILVALTVKWEIISKKLISKIGIGFSLFLIILLHIIPAVPDISLGEANTWSGWKDAAQKVAKLQQEQGGPDSCFVFANSYKAASLMKFYLPVRQDVYAENIYDQPALQFGIWGKPESLRGKSALYIFDDRREYRNDLKKVEPFFKDLQLLQKFEYSFMGKHTRTISCYLGTGYAEKEQ